MNFFSNLVSLGLLFLYFFCKDDIYSKNFFRHFSDFLIDVCENVYILVDTFS